MISTKLQTDCEENPKIFFSKKQFQYDFDHGVANQDLNILSYKEKKAAGI